MIRDLALTVPVGGIRLDAAILSAAPTSTRAFVREAIEHGEVFRGNSPDGEVLPLKGLKLRAREKLFVRALAEATDNLVSPFGVCPQPVFEDDALLGFNKGIGIPVQPLSHTETGTLMNMVVTRYPECRALGDRPLLAGAIHRIDADTSGLVLVARSPSAFENVRAQFAAQTVEKTYLALVEGHVAVGGTLEHDLIHDPTLPFCRMIDARHDRHSPIASSLKKRRRDPDYTDEALRKTRPLHAVTAFKPLAYTSLENEERTLLEVTIFTGVTHQIRAQLALARMHIVNDRLYGGFAIEGMVGHCLHSLAASLTHPVSGLPLRISTPYPAWARL